ncbi:LLM class flavin-dependent oxidoreductase [Nakamurella sp. YIM 132087]|uniref:LLM class flavin-dependent oxidoreductase n=1 Tax=Nakamurella alba TaxID=2665158 RepID=A0A7K1FEN6_9ACTN|nr:LLM class flavin-dependent oxidoreductase [Nakamurella alba]MTD12567.1 LLM class flavin-dependent oxidoreductase [Nakamurella alba]
MNKLSNHRAVLDRTVPTAGSRLLGGPNKLKLAVFGPNLSGGAGVLTTLDGPPVVGNWNEARSLVVAADRAGFEAAVPVVRWKGFRSESGFWDRSLDTFTWAAGVAAVTESITVFTSCMVPMVHPVFAAKAGATIDHIAGGRWGLNVVSGWIMPEFRMFGLPELDGNARYAYADEWTEVVTRLWATDEEFDHEGQFFQLRGLASEPKPMSTPRPLIMNAGMSAAGKDFALRRADIMFIQINSPDVATIVADLRAAATAAARPLSIWGTALLVCRPTVQEASEYVARFVDANADVEGIRRFAETLLGNASGSHANIGEGAELIAKLSASGRQLPIVGTPEMIVDKLAWLSELGLDGLGLTWIDYDEGIAQFHQELLPLLVEAGLRV